MTRRTRHAAARRANAAVAELVAARNAAGCEQLTVLDEEALRREHGDGTLGRLLYDSGQDEPVYTLGRCAASSYREHLYVRAYLAGKKLVACDLDNTLWEGLIGEGSIRHHAGRQTILRRLRERGVLLAICSKNNAENVRWEGQAILHENDFACRADQLGPEGPESDADPECP